MDTEQTFFLALKDQRESKDITLDEISDFTKINPKYITAIEKGEFNILPNIYMRLFIRSYADYVGADSKQALADYELYTTGKIQPNFIVENESLESKSKSDSIPSFESNLKFDENFQINYRQVGTILFVIIVIFLSFRLISYITSDTKSEIINNDTSSSISLNQNTNAAIPGNENSKASIIKNFNFQSSSLYSQITDIISLKDPLSLKVQTQNRTKLNISTYNKDGSIFFSAA